MDAVGSFNDFDAMKIVRKVCLISLDGSMNYELPFIDHSSCQVGTKRSSYLQKKCKEEQKN